MKARFTLFALLTSAIVCAASFISVDELRTNESKYDKKEVTVRGRLNGFEAKTSKAGNKYTTFKLKGAKQTINGYMRGHLPKAPKDGELVEVFGVYRKVKEVGNRTFKNEIDITPEKGKKFGLKVIR